MEINVSIANADEPNMALTNWKGKIVRKQDIYIAKNYLSEDELDSLNRFVVVFLETAELRAKDRKYITMIFWKDNVDRIIEFNDKKLLADSGSITKIEMERIADEIYDKFNARRKEEAKQADKDDLDDLKRLEDDIKNRT